MGQHKKEKISINRKVISAMPQLSLQKYREYFYSTGSAAEISSLFFKGLKRSYMEDLETVLTEYKLADRLAEAKTQGRKLRLLHLECGEGLYLHCLAEMLEERGLLDAAELFGIAGSKEIVSTAEEFSKISNPPRPYLQFYWHDLQTPLAETPIMQDAKRQVRFDFIFGGVLATHSANIERIYSQIFAENLNPGGVVYFAAFITQEENPLNTVDPHPALTPATKATFRIFGNNNPGVEVSQKLAEWLTQWGANHIKTVQHRLATGGTSEEGKSMLRIAIINIVKFGQNFIKMGLITQAEYDELIRAVYHELTPQMSGYNTIIVTLGAKPLLK